MEKAPRVLVVDSDARMRELLLEQLDGAGIEADAADDVPSALQKLQERDYNAVLAAVQLSGSDGFELLERVRETAGDKPVILMPSFDDVRVRAHIRSTGAFACLPRPFRRGELLDLVRRACAA